MKLWTMGLALCSAAFVYGQSNAENKLNLTNSSRKKLFTETTYKGILRVDNTIKMMTGIETIESCVGYEFVVDDDNDFSADCVDNRIEITHNSPDVPRDGHLTLTLIAKSTSFSAISDFTKIILEIPLTTVEKLFIETTYEATLKEDNSIQMTDEIKINKSCADYQFVVDDDTDFRAECVSNNIKVIHKRTDVHRDGHLTLTLYSKLISNPAIFDFTKIILELPPTKITKLFKESSYEGTLEENDSVHMIDEIETNEPCAGYDFVVDDDTDFRAECVSSNIKIIHKRTDVHRDGHLTLTLYSNLISDPAILDFTKIILELPPTKITKLFKESSYEGTLEENDSVYMIDEIETNEPCAGYKFMVDDDTDFRAECVTNKIEITHKGTDVHKDGHLTLTLYSKLISDPAILDFTKIILELPPTKIQKLFKESIYEGILEENDSVHMIDEIETNEPCAGYNFVVDDDTDFRAECVTNKIEITHKKTNVHRDGHLTLTLYSELISDPAVLDFTKIILELPPTKITKLFKESSYEGTLEENDSVHMIDEIETNEPCAGYKFVVDDDTDFSAVCVRNNILITHKRTDVHRDGHLTLTLYSKLISDPAISDFTKIILELPVTKVDKLFKESIYEGTLRENNTIQMIDEIETIEPCLGYEFVVDDSSDFSVDCVSNKIEITYKHSDVLRDGHLTLTLYAKSIYDPAISDLTIIILELPPTKVEKLFKESSYEGTLKENNTIQMIDEIETIEPCLGYEFVVDDGSDFSVDCVSNIIEITHKHSDVLRDGHLTLTLYATSTTNPAISDFTKIILKLPLTKVEKLFIKSSYEGILTEDSSVQMIDEIETIEPCLGYEFVVDDSSDFSVDCVSNKIEITYKHSDVLRDGHLTLTLYAKSIYDPAILDLTIIILELPPTKVEKLFKESSYEGTLKENNTIQMIDEIETIEPCLGYEFVVDDGSDFSVDCVSNIIEITHKHSDVLKDGHLTLTLYAKSIYDPAISDLTIIILELPIKKVEKLFKESSYEGTLREENSIEMEVEIEINEPCADFYFVVDDGTDFSAVCVNNKIAITHKKSDVHRDGHLTLTLYAKLISDPAISDFTKIILELPVTMVEKLFKKSSYEGILREDNTVEMIDKIETNKPCAGNKFVVDDDTDFSAECVSNKIEITHINSDVLRDGHLTLTLYAKLLADPAISDFTKVILELPPTKVEKLFKESTYEATLREDNTIHMIDEIKTMEPCDFYNFEMDNDNDFNAICVNYKIEITHNSPDVPRNGHLTLTLNAKLNSVSALWDSTKIILELPPTKVEKLFIKSTYEGILREDNTIKMIDEIETMEPCKGYVFVVDNGKDFSAHCDDAKIKIIYKNPDVPRDGHLTLTLIAKSTAYSALWDFTKIILELPLTKGKKFFIESTYEGTLRKDNTIQMIDEIETMEPCKGYEFVVDDGNDFCADCINNKIKIAHKSRDVPRDGHLTLILYAKLNYFSAILDFTKIILELPFTKDEKLFMESTYEGILREDNTINMIDEIETMEPCEGYEFVVDVGNDFSADCDDAKIKIILKNPDVPRDGHLTLILYAKSNSIYTIDTTVLILEVTCEDGTSLCSNDVGLIVAVVLLSIILVGILIANAVFCCQNKSLLFRARQLFGVERNF